MRLQDVEAALAGDPRDALRGLMAAPSNAVRTWGEERSSVLARVDAEFGIALSDAGLDPEAIADAVAVDLALAGARDAFGRPADFPFLSRLPERPEPRERQVAFLRDDVLSHAELGPRFRARLRRLEHGYPLADWAKDRAGHPGGLPGLAQTRWRRFLERLEAASAPSWKAAREFLRAERAGIVAAAAAPWAALETEVRWATMQDLSDLVLGAEEMLAEAETLGTAAEYVAAYAARWWRLDRLHLAVRAGARAAHLQVVRQVGDAAYFDGVARLSDRFCALVEQAGTWPVAGTTGVAELRPSLRTLATGRQAVMVTDACRWDLAAELATLLEDGDCTLTPVLATLPSITPFGMAALLPLTDEPVAVELGGGKLAIHQGVCRDLDTRDGRKELLRATLVSPEGQAQVEFMDLDALLRREPIPATPMVVVFDNAIDEQGHKGTEQFPELVPTFVRDLRRAITTLHEGGVDTVHLVTDHGFLLLPPDAVDSLGRPEVLPAQAHTKHDRWAILKPDAPVAEVICLPATLAPAVRVGIPRGVRTLEKAESYLHGGISLQECVIPHLVSQRVHSRARLGVDLQVRTDTLTGGTVPVILRPRLAPGQPGLEGYEPIMVQVWVETADEKPTTVAPPVVLELRADVDELKPGLYLQEGLNLAAGQQLRLCARDVGNGEDLGACELTLLVDWD